MLRIISTARHSFKNLYNYSETHPGTITSLDKRGKFSNGRKTYQYMIYGAGRHSSWGRTSKPWGRAIPLAAMKASSWS